MLSLKANFEQKKFEELYNELEGIRERAIDSEQALTKFRRTRHMSHSNSHKNYKKSASNIIDNNVFDDNGDVMPHIKIR